MFLTLLRINPTSGGGSSEYYYTMQLQPFCGDHIAIL